MEYMLFNSVILTYGMYAMNTMIVGILYPYIIIANTCTIQIKLLLRPQMKEALNMSPPDNRNDQMPNSQCALQQLDRTKRF